MGLLDTVREQQKGHESAPAFMIGEQLLEMAQGRPELEEILDQDLQMKEMSLVAAAGHLQAYANKNHGKEKCFCIPPQMAEKLLREFYGLPEPEAGEESRQRQEAAAEPQGGYIDLDSFLV